MTSAASGTIWTPKTTTTKALRPWKRNLASASAARNASTTETMTTARTTIRLLRTLDQKRSRPIASRKLSSVGLVGMNWGVKERISPPCLNDVETIQ